MPHDLADMINALPSLRSVNLGKELSDLREVVKLHNRQPVFVQDATKPGVYIPGILKAGVGNTYSLIVKDGQPEPSEIPLNYANLKSLLIQNPTQ